jgi:hypothetical protein
MDGARIVTVQVFPLQYRPKSKRLFIVNYVSFEFVFSPNILPELRARIRGVFEQKVYDAAFKNVVENDNEIPLYYLRPTLVEEDRLGGSRQHPG